MAEQEPAPIVPAANRAATIFEHSVERVGDVVWHRLRHRPYIGIALTSALALTVASLVGVGELAVAGLAGYAMFQMLRRNEPPSQAFRDVTRIEKELGL
jgi:hypothetical protein